MNPDPVVTPEELVTPPAQVEVPEPVSAPNASIAGARTVADATDQEIVRIDTEQSRQRDDILNILGNAGPQDTAGTRAQANEQFGVNQAREDLSRENLRLTSLVNSFDEIDARIQSAQGQSEVRQSAQLGQLNRERAVEVKAQAAIVTALQGNYELAAQQANQAVQDAQADRLANLAQLDAQYDRLSGIVDQETQQVLDLQAEERANERNFLKQVSDNVSAAVASGVASQAEISALTDPNMNDGEKLALAQSVQARAAQEAQAREIAEFEANQLTTRLQQSNIRSQIADRGARLEIAQAALQNPEAAEEQELREAETEQALQIKDLANQLLVSDGGGAAVGFGFKKSIVGALPFLSGDAIAGTNRADFEAIATRLGNLLTLDNLDLMSGVLSETDIKILESSGSNLKNFDQSEEAYIQEVERIISVMDRTISNNGVTPEQAVFYGLAQDDDISEIDTIYNQ